MALFKRNWEKESGKSTVFRLAFKVFYVHIMTVIIWVVISFILIGLENLLKTQLTSKPWVIGLINIICLAFYLLDVYVESWRTGARDLNLVNFQHIDYNPAKPVIAGFASQILGLIAAVIALFDSLSLSFLAKRFLTFFYLNFLYPISLVNKGEASKIFYFIPILIGPIVCTIAYHLGYKEIRVLDKLMYKKPEKKNDRTFKR